jgi:GNAT superfamily N-acetyltransferase
MPIKIVPVQTAIEKKLFIDYEWQANKHTENWVSPLRMERTALLNTKKNPFFSHAKIELFLCYKSNKIAGRIAAITNENHNSFHNDNVGFWGFFECIDNQEVANALFDAAADWLKAEKKDKMLGPMNPSTNDECGTLIEGFDTKPFIMMRHNPKFYPTLIENYGNTKAKDLWAWYTTPEHSNKNISEKMERVASKIIKKYSLTIRNISVKKIKSEIKLIKEVYNNAWTRNWGFVPFTDAEIDHVASDLKDIADDDLMFMAEKGGKPIGFCITLPNINEVLERIPNGKLFPTGIFKLLFGIKKIKSVRTIIMGVNKEYQFLGLGSIFYIKSIKKALDKGYTGAEMSWILEDNDLMNKAIESIGSKVYKKYRIYQYDLV